jgi:phycocyanin beta chain
MLSVAIGWKYSPHFYFWHFEIEMSVSFSNYPGENQMVMDAFTRVVAQADARGDYLSDMQLDGLLGLVSDGNKRIDAVNRITSNSSSLVTKAARSLFDDQPQLINPGGNAYTNRRAAACLRDLDIILRYVTYAIFAGDVNVLEDRALNGLRETYLALGVPGSSVALGILKLKEHAIALVSDPSGITAGDCTSLIAEISIYFDRAAAAVA